MILLSNSDLQDKLNVCGRTQNYRFHWSRQSQWGSHLTISDHLDWQDSSKHQSVLQEKINSYLAFIESGEIFESYPDSKGRPVAIKVIFKHKPDQGGRQFLVKAKEVIQSAGFNLRHEVFAESYDN